MAYKMYLGGVLMPITPSKVTVKINNQNKTMTLINGEEINIELDNKPQKGIIQIYKTGAQLASVVENEDGTYSLVYEEMPLEGAEFTVTAAEDIVTGDGVTRANEGDVVAVITSGEDGIATTEELYLGKYNVEETKVPEGFVGADGKHEVELIYADQLVELVEADLDVNNTTQKAEVSFDKVMERDNLFNLGNGEEYKDVQFGLYTADEIVAADGTSVPAGGLLEVATPADVEETLTEKVADAIGTDKLTGNEEAVAHNVKFTSQFPAGDYYVQEMTTNSMYKLDETQHEFTFEYGDPTNEVVSIQLTDEPIQNDLIRGTAKLIKVNLDGKGLEGAQFTLTDANGNKVFDGLTDKNGVIAIENLPAGDYTWTEVTAPKGYVLDKTAHNFTIEEDGAVVETTVENKLIPTPKTGDTPNFIIPAMILLAGLAGYGTMRRKELE